MSPSCAVLGLIAALKHQLAILALPLGPRRSSARNSALRSELGQHEALHVVRRPFPKTN